MKLRSFTLLSLMFGAVLFAAEPPPARTPAQIFASALAQLVALVEPLPGAEAKTFTATAEVLRAEGLPSSIAGQKVALAFQAPDRFRVEATVDRKPFIAGRDGQELWIHAVDKQFGVVGKAGVPRFATAPEKLDTTVLRRFKLPLPQEQLVLLPLLMNVEALAPETLDQQACDVLAVTPKPEAIQALKIPNGRLTLWVRQSDSFPIRIGLSDGGKSSLVVHLRNPQRSDPWPADRWKLAAKPGDRIETTALSHITRFMDLAWSILNQHVPSLGPATGERRLIATEGAGRLEIQDGTRVLFLKGNPEEMGRQHGKLLRKEIRNVTERILYGVGVGSSFEKGRWFFGEIEEAQQRIAPFIDARYLAEMDAIAQTAGLEKEEIRLANFFPELFHCSGFALFGKATVDGRMYHGRILDYLRGVGLEQNAVVIVMQPSYGNAWVNVSYAGFVGSVTAMNERQVSIGEMGGRGEGNWDGKPMAQLVREVMERANTLDEAVEIMRKGPRTCEYYYVIADAKSKRAVGVAATPTTFEIVLPGEAHPRLPHPQPDTVLLSAGDRYLKLSERVQAKHGSFDADSARDLMLRPVAMNSNIHSVLFAPESLDFWVANADSANVASHTRFTHYNLAELLRSAPPAPAVAAP